ncbi:Protein BCCIP-like protein [Frankliniella fusca]|uniref:Protein BCCIP-like protein n=1 Tax=Frankliniella fusca TaxID=407009 RepID=A0AAE1H1F8_9NEOP|nr:Protein BCCIP-like protein [Frankliniella fusca]
MSDSGEDDLPDLAIGNFNENKPYIPTKIDVDAEIAKNLERKERRKQIAIAKSEYEKQAYEPVTVKSIQEPTIQTLPPSRPIFNPERSLIYLNQDHLTTEQFFPSPYKFCTSDNVDEFFYWIQSKLKSSSDDCKQKFLQYLWLLLSCHSDRVVVEKCCSMLLEHNQLWKCWRLKYEEVVFVFCNWGVAPEDFISGLDSRNISSSLEPSPIISLYNVENILTILDCQLMIQDLESSEENYLSSKAIFIFLVLLPLDHKFLRCLPEVFKCLERLADRAKSHSSSWLEDYCAEILRLESHHARVAFLLECVVPESMRWCLCLAYCQKVFGLQPTFVADPDPTILRDLLLDARNDCLLLDSWDLYSLISIVDSGISCVINYETDRKIKEDFLEWLSLYMIRRNERRANLQAEEIDVDAAILAELVSRMQAQWESKWLSEPHNNLPIEIEEQELIGGGHDDDNI